MAREAPRLGLNSLSLSNDDRPYLFEADFVVIHDQHGAVHRAKVYAREEAVGVHLVPCPIYVRHSNPPAYEWFDFLDGHPAIRAVPFRGGVAPGIIGGLVPAFQNLAEVGCMLDGRQYDDEVILLQFGVSIGDEPMFTADDPYDVGSWRKV